MFCKLLGRGVEMLFLRWGLPLAAMGLVNSDGGIFPSYIQLMSSASYADFRAALQDPTTEELAVVQAFANICHAGGQVLPSLVERRLCEAQLYLSGNYSTTPTDYTYSVIGDTVTVRYRR